MLSVRRLGVELPKLPSFPPFRMPRCRYFAVIPAAGRSRRMGWPKLLAEVAGRPLIDWVLDAWRGSHVDEVVVVVRREQQELAEQCRDEAGGREQLRVLATSESPRTMRDTLQLGLRSILERHRPQPSDAWLVAPADMPGLSAAAIDRLLTEYDPRAPRVLVPQVNGERGHPVLLPWSLVAAFDDLPREFGLNTFVRQCDARCIPLADGGLLADIDTPHDYLQWPQPIAGR